MAAAFAVLVRVNLQMLSESIQICADGCRLSVEFRNQVKV